MASGTQSIFPVVSQNAYADAGSSPASVGSALLAGANQRFSYFQQFAGLGLNPAGRLRRLFLLHKLALDSELKGQRRRADFFWRSLHRTLARTDASFWESVSASPTIGLPADQLRAEVRIHWIAATHAALYRGLQRAGDHGRAMEHFKWLEAAAGTSSGQPPENSLSAQILDETIRMAAGNGDWQAAVTAGELLAARYPEREGFRLALGRARYLAALQSVSKAANPAEAASALQAALAALAHLRSESPHALCLMQWSAYLSHLLSLQMRKTYNLADALVENARARCLDPELDVAQALRQRLLEDLERLRSEARALSASMSGSERLSVEGERVVQQLQSGTGPADHFEQSAAAQQMLKDYAIGKALRIWVEVGGNPPNDEESALLLERELSSSTEDAHRVEDFAKSWREAVQAYPQLAVLDAARVESFAGEPTWEDPMPPMAPLAPAVPVLQPAPAVPGPDVPFHFWWWSREDTILKLQVVAAVVLFVWAGTFALRQRSHWATRATAYVNLKQALDRRDTGAAIDQAETFLGATVAGTDSREPEVRGWYSESLVRWFADRDENDPQVKMHLARYRALAVGGGGESK